MRQAPGSYFMFTEVSRDPGQIILSHPSRQKLGDANKSMLVRLPLHVGSAMVLLELGGNEGFHARATH